MGVRTLYINLVICPNHGGSDLQDMWGRLSAPDARPLHIFLAQKPPPCYICLTFGAFVPTVHYYTAWAPGKEGFMKRNIFNAINKSESLGFGRGTQKSLIMRKED
jgi:hypothetical protein